MTYKNNLLYIHIITLIFLITDTTCQLNETTTTSTPETTPDTTQIYTSSIVSTATRSPTSEPTLEPTYIPTIYTSKIPTINPTIEPTYIPTTYTTTKKPIIIEVTITIIIDYGNSTITVSDITNIITALISEELPGIKIQALVPKSNIESDNEISITWTMELIAYSDTNAELIEDTIESEEFKQDLQVDIETFNNNYNVNNIQLEATIIDDENNTKSKITWLDPTTYGLLNWIIIGAALCILCIFCLFICRCCYLCCNKTRRMRRAKSGYQVGKPMFGATGTNTDADSAFQSDLRQAIEMNNQKKLLQNVDNVGTLNIDEVNAAFDQDFDEIKPINKTTNVNNIKKVSSASDKENNVNDNAHSDDEKKEDSNAKKKKTTVGSEGIIKSEIGDTLIPNVTPGGPNNITPDGDDDAPPPPQPPTKEDVSEMDEYDLL